MPAQTSRDIQHFSRLIAHPQASAWLVAVEGQSVGLITFEGASSGGADILADPQTISITGAYLRPEQRGQRLMPAMLNAALQDYADQGYTRCAVDFKSFNPEAAAFWPRYFELAVMSMIRVPERPPQINLSPFRPFAFSSTDVVRPHLCLSTNAAARLSMSFGA